MVAIIDNAPQKAKFAAQEFPNVPFYACYQDFLKDKIPADIVSEANVGGHMGGDYFMMNSLYKVLNGEKAEGVTYLDVSIESHLMSFAAEESRLDNGKPYDIVK